MKAKSPIESLKDNNGGDSILIKSPPEVILGIMKNNAIRHHQRVASFQEYVSQQINYQLNNPNQLETPIKKVRPGNDIQAVKIKVLPHQDILQSYKNNSHHKHSHSMQNNEEDKKHLMGKVPPLMLADSLFAEQIQLSMLPGIVNGAGIRKRNPNIIIQSEKLNHNHVNQTSPPPTKVPHHAFQSSYDLQVSAKKQNINHLRGSQNVSPQNLDQLLHLSVLSPQNNQNSQSNSQINLAHHIKSIISRNSTQMAQNQTKPSLENMKSQSPSMTNLHKHVSSHTQLFNLLKEINQQPWKVQQYYHNQQQQFAQIHRSGNNNNLDMISLQLLGTITEKSLLGNQQSEKDLKNIQNLLKSQSKDELKRIIGIQNDIINANNVSPHNEADKRDELYHNNTKMSPGRENQSVINKLAHKKIKRGIVKIKKQGDGENHFRSFSEITQSIYLPPKMAGKPPRQSHFEVPINEMAAKQDDLRRLSQTYIGGGEVKNNLQVQGFKPSISDHRSGYAVKSHNFEESYRLLQQMSNEITLYPNSPKGNNDIQPALQIETFPPEVEEDFQIPINQSSKRHSDYKRSSINRYSIIGSQKKPQIATSRESNHVENDINSQILPSQINIESKQSPKSSHKNESQRLSITSNAEEKYLVDHHSNRNLRNQFNPIVTFPQIVNPYSSMLQSDARLLQKESTQKESIQIKQYSPPKGFPQQLSPSHNQKSLLSFESLNAKIKHYAKNTVHNNSPNNNLNKDIETQLEVGRILSQMGSGPLSQQAIHQIKNSVDQIFFNSNFKKHPDLKIIPDMQQNSSQGFKQTGMSNSPMSNIALQGKLNFTIGDNKYHITKIDEDDAGEQTPFQQHMMIQSKLKKQLAQSNQGAMVKQNLVKLPSIARLSLNNSPFEESNYQYVLQEQQQQFQIKRQSNLDTYHFLKQKSTTKLPNKSPHQPIIQPMKSYLIPMNEVEGGFKFTQHMPLSVKYNTRNDYPSMSNLHQSNSRVTIGAGSVIGPTPYSQLKQQQETNDNMRRVTVLNKNSMIAVGVSSPNKVRIGQPVVKTAISGINGVAVRREKNPSTLIMEDVREFHHREHTPSEWQRYDTPTSAFEDI